MAIIPYTCLEYHFIDLYSKLQNIPISSILNYRVVGLKYKGEDCKYYETFFKAVLSIKEFCLEGKRKGNHSCCFYYKDCFKNDCKNCTVDDKYSAIRRSILPISETTDGLRSRVIECSIKQVAVIKRFYELGYIYSC